MTGATFFTTFEMLLKNDPRKAAPPYLFAVAGPFISHQFGFRPTGAIDWACRMSSKSLSGFFQRSCPARALTSRERLPSMRSTRSSRL